MKRTGAVVVMNMRSNMLGRIVTPGTSTNSDGGRTVYEP
jgi:hypothetical protein